jgi:hypothetical protein
MADLRKAAEIALEALETYWMGENAGKNGLNAIQALRQALAMEKFSEVNQEIEEALKQPEQEREWVGLTEEDFENSVSIEIGVNGSLFNSRKFAKQIEQILKEKNGYE